MNRTVILLAFCQAMLMTIVSLVLSSSALIGVQLSSPDLATVPLSIQYLATMLLLFPVAWLMEIYGRRRVFATGALVGAFGLGLAAAGIHFGSFALFTVAGFLIGVFSAIGQYYRFAAADSVPAARKSEAISLTLTGGVLAAMLGPILARLTKDVLDPPFFASFLALIGVAMLAALFSLGLRLPPPTKDYGEGSRRPFAEIARQPKFQIAVVSGVVGYGTMNLLMSATPLAMMHVGHGFANTATVIQWHIVAMFAPSFFTGKLIQRIGILRVMLLGCLLNLACIGVSLNGVELAHFEFGLILLGVGWNFLYVGATTLLTETYRKEERSTVQAFNDTVVFLVVTLATMFAGKLVNSVGWQDINLYSILPIAIVMICILWLIIQASNTRFASSS